MNYINGEWVEIDSKRGHEVSNPATGEVLTSVPFSDEQTVDDAVTAGGNAFESWRHTPVEERIQPLFRLKQLLEQHQDELAELLVKDHGKTLSESSGELRRGIENVEVACGIPSMIQGNYVEHAAPDIDEAEIRQPIGVFVGVTPFNFPGMIPLWFLPYAVATGNAFILKPSEQVPLVAQRLFELIDAAGFPDGIAQLVNGDAATVDSFLTHPDVAGISFVGSTPVAEHVYATAASNGKRVQAQGGAKNHVVVTASADLAYAAEKTVSSAFACAGERCLANDIVLVADSVHDAFVECVLEAVDDQQVGYGLDPDVTIGSLISSEHEARVRGYIESGIEEGANLLRDGRSVEVEGFERGNFLGPTVFTGVTDEMTLSQEELFGPILGISSVNGLTDAIERINRNKFANAASIFTGEGADARTFRLSVDAGNVGVNVGTVAPMAFFHFGGNKASFYGDLHAQGEDMIWFYTDKTVYIERWPGCSI